MVRTLLRVGAIVLAVSVASLEAAGTTIQLIDAVKQGNRTAVRAHFAQFIHKPCAQTPTLMISPGLA